MFKQDIMLRSVPWSVRVYYEVDTYNADEILDELISLGCNGENLKRAKENLWIGKPNTGLTYANIDVKDATMVISKTTSADEFYNSFVHEQFHLLSYIAKEEGLDPLGEDICYVAGELAGKMFEKAKGLMCDCCRDKRRRFRPVRYGKLL